LGYNLTVIHTICDLWEALSPTSGTHYDFVITDYDGLGAAENIGDFPRRHCRYFIVDGFGTQPEFNKRNLDLKKVLTPYPFDGSNTPIHLIAEQLPPSLWITPRKFQAVIWAKSYRYLQEKVNILREISKHIPLIGTFGEVHETSEGVIDFITQHGFMNRTSFLQLLSSSVLLIGVGGPLDGPTALEAIAHGCIYLNPRFDPPVHAENKPTKFLYTSQHPFAELYIPPPHTYTVNLHNRTALAEFLAILSVNNSRVAPAPFIHPFHTPANFIANLRQIFSSESLSRCEHNSTRSPPHRHPNNQVYRSFLEFLQKDCGSSCLPHWTQIKPTATPSIPSNSSSSCVARFMEQITQQGGVAFEIRGDSLYVFPVKDTGDMGPPIG
jgi:hypothetical protein